jgi:hypothetical protein
MDYYEEERMKFLSKIEESLKNAYFEFLDVEKEILEKEGPGEAREYRRKIHDEIIESMKSDLEMEFYQIYILTGFGFHRPDLTIYCDVHDFREMFHCRNLWVELEIENEVDEEKLGRLKNTLSHDWSILIINREGKTRIENQSAWDQVEYLRKIISEI